MNSILFTSYQAKLRTSKLHIRPISLTFSPDQRDHVIVTLVDASYHNIVPVILQLRSAGRDLDYIICKCIVTGRVLALGASIILGLINNFEVGNRSYELFSFIFSLRTFDKISAKWPKVHQNFCPY
jgi:hypothetical protein